MEAMAALVVMDMLLQQKARTGAAGLLPKLDVASVPKSMGVGVVDIRGA